MRDGCLNWPATCPQPVPQAKMCPSLTQWSGQAEEGSCWLPHWPAEIRRFRSPIVAPSLVARLTSENPPTSTAQTGSMAGCPADQPKSDDNSAQRPPHWLSISGSHVVFENRHLDDKTDDVKTMRSNSDPSTIFVKQPKAPTKWKINQTVQNFIICLLQM